jgi:hypothetical protein
MTTLPTLLHGAITLPGGADGLWTLLFVPLSIVIAALGGVVGILLMRRDAARGPGTGDDDA